MRPTEHALVQFLPERAFLHQKRKHRAPKTLGKKTSGHRRQRDKMHHLNCRRNQYYAENAVV